MVHDFLSWIFRGLGLALVFFGALVLWKVFGEAWAIYQDPHHIERFAAAVEDGLGVDRSLTGLISQADKADGNANSGRTALSVSYLISWPLIVMVLLLVGKIGVWSLDSGARLAVARMGGSAKAKDADLE